MCRATIQGTNNINMDRKTVFRLTGRAKEKNQRC